jgi:FkbM family methyltransferase
MKRYPFGKFLLDTPDEHGIFQIHKDAVLYDRAFGFILEEIAKAAPEAVMLDIGGNIGDTAALFATYVKNPIISVEGNAEFLEFFRRNRHLFGNQVTLVEGFVRTDSLSTLNLIYQSGAGSGKMTVSDSQNSVNYEFISTDTLIEMAKGRNQELCLVKSDTDGMDGFIVSDFLHKTDAALFFECDMIATMSGVSNPWPAFFDSLTEKAYCIVVYDNFGLPMLIEERNPGKVLVDLAGYVSLQRTIPPIRIWYYDVWAFSPKWRSVFDEVALKLRKGLLRPTNF